MSKQRKQRTKKYNPRKVTMLPVPPIVARLDNRSWNETKLDVTAMLPVWAALESLKMGTCTADVWFKLVEFGYVAGHFATIHCRESTLADEVENGMRAGEIATTCCAALEAIGIRYRERGSFIARASELEGIRSCLSIVEQFLEVMSAGLILEAFMYAERDTRNVLHSINRVPVLVK